MARNGLRFWFTFNSIFVIASSWRSYVVQVSSFYFPRSPKLENSLLGGGGGGLWGRQELENSAENLTTRCGRLPNRVKGRFCHFISSPPFIKSRNERNPRFDLVRKSGNEKGKRNKKREPLRIVLTNEWHRPTTLVVAQKSTIAR